MFEIKKVSFSGSISTASCFLDVNRAGTRARLVFYFSLFLSRSLVLFYSSFFLAYPSMKIRKRSGERLSHNITIIWLDGERSRFKSESLISGSSRLCPEFCQLTEFNDDRDYLAKIAPWLLSLKERTYARNRISRVICIRVYFRELLIQDSLIVGLLKTENYTPRETRAPKRTIYLNK